MNGFFSCFNSINQKKSDPPIAETRVGSRGPFATGYESIMKQRQNLKPGTCEQPQGVRFLFLLASLKNTGKKPHPPGAFPGNPLYYITFSLFFFFCDIHQIYTEKTSHTFRYFSFFFCLTVKLKVKFNCNNSAFRKIPCLPKF